MSRRSGGDAVFPHQLREGDIVVLDGHDAEVVTGPAHTSTTKQVVVYVVTPGRRAEERPREIRLPEWSKVERKRKPTG